MIPTNISRPQDIAIIFAILAGVVITIGFGIESINARQNATIDTSYFDAVYGRVNSSTGLKGSADTVSGGLIGEEGASTDTSEEGILVKGFNSILALGKTYKAASDSLSTGTGWLGIDPIYWILFTSVMLLSFGVVMYTWIRGR